MLLKREDERAKTPVMVYVLAVLPVFDCILNQVNNAFDISFGPVSLLQAVRANFLLLLGLSLVWQFFRNQTKLTGLHVFGLAGLVGLLGVAITKELVLTGSVSMASLGSYGQFAYWILIGMVATGVCATRRDAEIVLYGIAAGALATAVSICIGYFHGGLNPYEEGNVRASAGWFHTAKTITGVLLTGSIVVLYLGRKSTTWWPAILAAFCFAACVVTYARTGIIALVAILVWFFFWWLTLGRNSPKQWLSKILLVAVLAGCCAPLLISSDSWQSRWEDVADPDKAGSGRATFWRIALHAYSSGKPAEQAFGLGYAGMSDMLLHDYGDDIKHTHNDLFDSMLVGGAVGIAWFLLWISYLISKTVSLNLHTIEGAAAAAVLLVYLFHSQFTGQLFGTDSMTYYVVTLACLYHIASLRTPDGTDQELSDNPIRQQAAVLSLQL
jgi:hypothetical protein